MAIPRKARFTERISKMRGLMPIEKDLLKRIGELVDGSLNNRGPANPGTTGRRHLIRSPLLPPPTNLRADVGPRNAKIEWNPVDSPILLMYELLIRNTETQLIQQKIAFTNRLNFGDQGTFEIKVRSVSRGGEVSPYNSVPLQITIQEDLLYLEGNQVGPTQTSNLIIEDIFTPADYRVFAWGAFNNANFVSLGQSSAPLMDLSVNGYYPLLSRLLMFRETAMFSNIDDTTIIGEDRPGNETRSGMFMTPLSAMFKPFYIDPGNPLTAGLVNTSPKFYMFLNDVNDAAGTALSLFSIPATVVDVEEDTFTSATSIDLTASAGSSLLFNDSGRQNVLGIGNQFTIGMWLKTYSFIDADFNSHEFQFDFFDFSIFGLPASGPLGPVTSAQFIFELDTQATNAVTPIPMYQHARCTVTAPPFSNINTANYNLQNRDSYPLFNTQGNGVADNIWSDTTGKWFFVAITYDSTQIDTFDFVSGGANLGNANKQKLFFHGQELAHRINISGNGIDNITGNVSAGISDNIILDTYFNDMRCFGSTKANAGGDRYPMRLYWIAMWDGLLAGGLDPVTGLPQVNQLAYLANNPTQDLRTNSGDYTSNANLAHWWVFGRNAEPTDVEDLCEDLGFGVPISLTRDISQSLAVARQRLKNDRPAAASGTSAGTGSDSTTFPDLL